MEPASTRVGVVGGGTMGSGIAIAALTAGFTTLVYEVNDELAAAVHERVDSFLAKGVNRGKISPQQQLDALANLTTTTDVDALADRHVIVEAVYEDLEIKQQLWSRLDEVCAEHAIFATNTSTLSVTQIAAGSRLPSRVIGTHFCNPAPLMPLVEIVRGRLTSDIVVERTNAWVEALGKRGVIVGDVPGFIVNRVLVPFENDCIRMFAAGVASVQDIDRSVQLGLGYPMGPFTLLDTVGLDIHRAVSLSLFTQLRDPRFAPPPLVDQMIAAGQLGRKTGRGFYEYDQPGMFGT